MSSVIWLLYLAEICNALGKLFGVILGLSLLGLLVIGFITFFEGIDDFQLNREKLKKLVKGLFVLACICLPLSIFIPSEKVVLAGAGVYVANEVVETANQSPLMNKTLKLIEKQIDEALKDKESVSEK